MTTLRASMILLLVVAITAAPTRLGANSPTDLADWRRVLALRPGQTLLLITDGSGARERQFVSADPSGLLVLNAHAGGAPVAALQDTSRLAAAQPVAVAATLSGGSISRRELELTPAGLFWHGQWVAGLDAILTRVDRPTVVEITAEGKTSQARTGIGLVVAGLASCLLGAAIKGPEAGPTPFAFVGWALMAAGGGMQHAERPREGLIYRRIDSGDPRVVGAEANARRSGGGGR
jgi:hypothetical protein